MLFSRQPVILLRLFSTILPDPQTAHENAPPKVKAFRLLRCPEVPFRSTNTLPGPLAPIFLPGTRRREGEAPGRVSDGGTTVTQLQRDIGDGYPPEARFASSTARYRRQLPCPGLYCQLGAGVSEVYQQQQLQSAMTLFPRQDPSNDGNLCEEADDDKAEAVGEETTGTSDEKPEERWASEKTTAPQGPEQDEREAAAEVFGSGEDFPPFQLPLKVKNEGSRRWYC